MLVMNTMSIPKSNALLDNYDCVIHAFISSGKNISWTQSNNDGYDALQAAASTGATESVRLLLTLDVDPNVQRFYGFTPLMHAAKCKQE